jgi:hypothetical protein
VPAPQASPPQAPREPEPADPVPPPPPPPYCCCCRPESPAPPGVGSYALPVTPVCGIEPPTVPATATSSPEAAFSLAMHAQALMPVLRAGASTAVVSGSMWRGSEPWACVGGGRARLPTRRAWPRRRRRALAQPAQPVPVGRGRQCQWLPHAGRSGWRRLRGGVVVSRCTAENTLVASLRRQSFERRHVITKEAPAWGRSRGKTACRTGDRSLSSGTPPPSH